MIIFIKIYLFFLIIYKINIIKIKIIKIKFKLFNDFNNSSIDVDTSVVNGEVFIDDVVAIDDCVVIDEGVLLVVLSF